MTAMVEGDSIKAESLSSAYTVRRLAVVWLLLSLIALPADSLST